MKTQEHAQWYIYSEINIREPKMVIYEPLKIRCKNMHAQEVNIHELKSFVFCYVIVFTERYDKYRDCELFNFRDSFFRQHEIASLD